MGGSDLFGNSTLAKNQQNFDETSAKKLGVHLGVQINGYTGGVIEIAIWEMPIHGTP
jgi:hypothetical protein